MSVQYCLQNIQNVIQPSYRVCSVVRFVQSPFTWINLGVTISVSTFWCSFTPEMPCPYPHRWEQKPSYFKVKNAHCPVLYSNTCIPQAAKGDHAHLLFHQFLYAVLCKI